MDSHNYESFITNVVETMLPPFSDVKIGLGMILKSQFDYYHDGKEFHHHRYFFVMFHRSSNYTKVLISTTDDVRGLSYKDKLEFDMISYHDCCWRSDGMKWIFQHWCDADNYFDEMGVDIRNGNWMFGFDLFGGGPKYYKLDESEILKFSHEKHVHELKIGDTISIKNVGPYLGE